jgi:hypothetical protein
MNLITLLELLSKTKALPLIIAQLSLGFVVDGKISFNRSLTEAQAQAPPSFESCFWLPLNNSQWS